MRLVYGGDHQVVKASNFPIQKPSGHHSSVLGNLKIMLLVSWRDAVHDFAIVTWKEKKSLDFLIFTWELTPFWIPQKSSNCSGILKYNMFLIWREWRRKKGGAEVPGCSDQVTKYG